MTDTPDKTLANQSGDSGTCRLPVTVIMTVKDDLEGCLTTLWSLHAQTRQPAQIVVVDGGSRREAIAAMRAHVVERPAVELIEAPGANIAAGRNIATQAARHEIIASIDAGCRAADDWLEKLVKPLIAGPSIGFVAGNYRVDTRALFEQVVGLATMRGQLDPVDPRKFNPSARSLAYRREVWKRAGGWPEWIRYSEDTLFDERVRKLDVGWAFVADAVVHWRPRTSWRGLAKQFYHYGTGRGHTQMGRADFLYNLRNLLLLLMLVVASLWSRWFAAPLAGHVLYFYVWAFHAKSLRIARRTDCTLAYPLSLVVHWVVLLSHLTGFLVGSMQRWFDKPRYVTSTAAYLGGSKV